MKQTITLSIYDLDFRIIEAYEVDNQLIVISKVNGRTGKEEVMTSELIVYTNSDEELPVIHYALRDDRCSYIWGQNAKVIHSLSEVYELKDKNLTPLIPVGAEKGRLFSTHLPEKEISDSENKDFSYTYI